MLYHHNSNTIFVCKRLSQSNVLVVGRIQIGFCVILTNLLQHIDDDKIGIGMLCNKIFVEKLPCGKGDQWGKTKAPDGHNAGGSYSFDITEQGETVEVFAANARIPQSGYARILDLVLLSTAASGGIAYTLYQKI